MVLLGTWVLAPGNICRVERGQPSRRKQPQRSQHSSDHQGKCQAPCGSRILCLTCVVIKQRPGRYKEPGTINRELKNSGKIGYPNLGGSRRPPRVAPQVKTLRDNHPMFLHPRPHWYAADLCHTSVWARGHISTMRTLPNRGWVGWAKSADRHGRLESHLRSRL